MESELILKFVFGLIGSLLGNLLFGSGGLEQVPSHRARDQERPPVVAQYELKVPGFVTHVPAGHFAGVSAPMPSLSGARKSAVDDVVRQVLGSVGVEYAHRYADTASGDAHNAHREIYDRLSRVARGVVLDTERSVVKSAWSQDSSGRYVYFVLVRYPEEKIREMRRLSKGAKVVASAVKRDRAGLYLLVRELNGVSVTLSSADVSIRRRNRFARQVTLFLWRVPEGSEKIISVAIGPVTVCKTSAQFILPIDKCEKRLEDYLLGAELRRIAVLKGYDEIGRAVNVKVSF